MEKRRRRRPALSCVECRARKVRCDRVHPCGPCVTHRVACTYRDYADEPSSESNRNDILARQYGVTAPLTPALSSAAGQAPRFPQTEEPSSAVVSPNDQHNAPGSAWVIGEATTGPDHESHTTVPAAGTPPRVGFKKTRLLKFSDLNGVLFGSVPEFSAIMSCYTRLGTLAANSDDAPNQTLRAIGALLSQCKQLARAAKLSRPSRSLVFESGVIELPGRALAERMMDAYFNFFESSYRILHEPSFRSEFALFWADPVAASMKGRLMIALVIAIGSSVSSEHLDRSMIENWIHAAEAWLAGPLEKDRLDRPAIQIHCLTLLARQVNCVGSDLMWVSSNALLAKALQVGLHRDPKYLPAMSAFAAEMRRRLWATVVEFSLQESLDAAMPLRLKMEDFDTDPPGSLTDERLMESSSASTQSPEPTLCNPSPQVLLSKTFRLRLHIVNLINNFHMDLSYQDVLSLTAELLEECRRLAATEGLLPHQQILLDFHIRRFLLPLNAPFAAKALTKPLYHYSYTIVTDVALSLMVPEPDEAYSQLITVAGGMFREAIRAASTLLSQRLLAETISYHRSGMLKRSSARLAPWKSALSDMRDLMSKRIEQGETNVKNHMFLSMVLAQVAALETGHDVDAAVQDAARNALQESHDVIAAKLNGVFPLNDDVGEASLGIDSLLTPEWSWDMALDGSLMDGDIGIML